jgi:hypothetical protein
MAAVSAARCPDLKSFPMRTIYCRHSACPFFEVFYARLMQQLSRSRRNLAFRGRMKWGRRASSLRWPEANPLLRRLPPTSRPEALLSRRGCRPGLAILRSGSRGSSAIGAGSSARRIRPMIVARRKMSCDASRICSLRVRIAIGAGQQKARAVRFGAPLLSFDDCFQLRAKLGALRVSQIDPSRELI